MTEKPKIIICRVCLRSDNKIKEKCMSLFEKYKHGLISDTINSIADIGIREGDGLPTKICPDCLLELDTAVNFKTKCEASNNLLKTTNLERDFKVESKITTQCAELIELNLESIKKEEPLDPEDYTEVDYLNDENTILDPQYDVKTDAEDESTLYVKEEDNVRKSRAIDLQLECHDCGGFFKSKCKLKVHWKKVHLYEQLICQFCKRNFRSFKAFNRHKKSNSNTCMIATKVNIEGLGKHRIFHCKDCHYHSRRIKDMQSHLYIHSGDRPFVCNICQKAFTQQSSLQSHQEASHKMFKVETTCQYCGKYIKGRNKVYRHLKWHTENVGVQCDICKKVLRTKKNLIVHLRRHSGIKTFTCEVCAWTFYTLSELCNHKRIKHEKRKYIYKCDLCAYTTLRSETLKKHKKRHTSTNLCCILCGIFVPNADTLVQHQKRHYKKFGCPYCELKYARKDSLHKHVRAKHKFTFCAAQPKPVVVKKETPTLNNVYEDAIEVKVGTTKFSDE